MRLWRVSQLNRKKWLSTYRWMDCSSGKDVPKKCNQLYAVQVATTDDNRACQWLAPREGQRLVTHLKYTYTRNKTNLTKLVLRLESSTAVVNLVTETECLWMNSTACRHQGRCFNELLPSIWKRHLCINDTCSIYASVGARHGSVGYKSLRQRPCW